MREEGGKENVSLSRVLPRGQRHPMPRRDLDERPVRRLVVAGRVPEERSLPRLVDLLLEMTLRASRQVADDPALSEDTTVDLLVDLWSSALAPLDPVEPE